MSDTLRILMDGFSRRIGGGRFECDAEGHVQLVVDDRFVVSLLHEPVMARIHLFAEAGCMPFGPPSDDPGRWQSSEEKMDADGFSSALRWHAATGALLQMASAPVALLDEVRFALWLKTFLDQLSALAEVAAAGPDIENPEVIDMDDQLAMA